MGYRVVSSTSIQQAEARIAAAVRAANPILAGKRVSREMLVEAALDHLIAAPPDDLDGLLNDYLRERNTSSASVTFSEAIHTRLLQANALLLAWAKAADERRGEVWRTALLTDHRRGAYAAKLLIYLAERVYAAGLPAGEGE